MPTFTTSSPVLLIMIFLSFAIAKPLLKSSTFLYLLFVICLPKTSKKISRTVTSSGNPSYKQPIQHFIFFRELHRLSMTLQKDAGKCADGSIRDSGEQFPDAAWFRTAVHETCKDAEVLGRISQDGFWLHLGWLLVRVCFCLHGYFWNIQIRINN